MNRLDDALATIDAALADGVTDVQTDDPAADYARRNLAVPLDALFPDRGVWNWEYAQDEPLMRPREVQRWRPAADLDVVGPDPWWHFPARYYLDHDDYQADLPLERNEAYRDAQEERAELLAYARMRWGVSLTGGWLT